MGAVADDGFMSSLIGTGNSLFNLELLSSSPFPPTKSNSRDRWLGGGSLMLLPRPQRIGLKILFFVAARICWIARVRGVSALL